MKLPSVQSVNTIFCKSSVVNRCSTNCPLDAIILRKRMKTKSDRIVTSAKLYVHTRIRHTKCMQEHFVQLCYRCNEFAGCKLYMRMFDRWTRLERAVNSKDNNV